MYICILKQSKNFQGVLYNTDKIEKNKGELMEAANFGALAGLGNLRPRDYMNYLEALSAGNSRIKFPQFHAVISAKGKSHNKDQLQAIAAQWLREMGYGGQPYLLVFHKDTLNNHIHILSTRVEKNGKKIAHAFERRQAWEILNRLTGFDPEETARRDLAYALNFHLENRAQFLILLKAKGYYLSLSGNHFRISKFGKIVAQVSPDQIDSRIATPQPDPGRIMALRQLIALMRQQTDASLYPRKLQLVGGWTTMLTGYSSRLADALLRQHQLEIIFHFTYGSPPSGYTVIDHANLLAFDGEQLMPLREFTRPYNGHSPAGIPETGGRSAEHQSAGWPDGFQIDITDDVDDEQVHGRNRNRRKK
jgi:hypothetical protein